MSVKTLVSEEQLKTRLKELGKEITARYKDECSEKNPLVCIVVLKGSFVFAADLIREIDIIPHLVTEFISVSSYGNNTSSSGEIKLLTDITSDITDKNVLIIEDIIDGGLTMKFLQAHFSKKNPKSIELCALLNKENKEIKINYTGFEISKNDFVIGYGLDYAQKYRNMKYIGCF